MRTSGHAERIATPGRLCGMGQQPSNNSCKELLECGFSQVPVIEYVTWSIDLPVPDADIAETFGNEIDILQDPKSVAGVTAVDSSFIINGLLQVDMMVMGFGIHAFAEPQQGTQICNVVNFRPAAGAVPLSPDTFTAVDASGNLTGPLGLATGQTMIPAELEIGVDAQNALWHMMNAYQFQWKFHQRHLLINE